MKTTDKARYSPKVYRILQFAVSASILLIVVLLAVVYAFGIRIVAPDQLAQANRLLKNPLPIPAYISNLQPAPGYVGNSSGQICHYVWNGQPLVANIDTGSYIPDNTTFMIDGITIYPKRGRTINLLLRATKTDENGKSVTVDGPLETCYDLPLGTGLHLASLSIKSRSGKVYSYQWAFEIK